MTVDDARAPADADAEAFADALVVRAEGGEDIDLDAELAALPAALQANVRAVLDATRDMYAKLEMAFPLQMSEARHLAGYRLGRLLGEGGMAKVHVATETATGRKVALKLLGKSAATAHLSARFRDEQRWAVLEHPGIVRVYGAGETEDVLFLAMEHVAGPSLAQVIAALANRASPSAIFALPGIDRTLERLALRAGEDARSTPAARIARPAHTRWCCEIAADVAAALTYAHDADLLHRDVKPSNILLHPDGRPRLADFGLARKQSEPGLTRSHERPGTAVYMSPQQLDPTEGAVDWRADVYALGVTLYELLTLERPFRSESETTLVREICTRRATSPERLNPAVPRDLAAIVMRALEKDPAHRYASAQAMEDDLRAFVAGKAVKANPAGMATRVVRRLRRDRSLRRMVGAGAAVVVVAAGWVAAGMAADRAALAQLETAVGQAVQEVGHALARGEHPTARAQAVTVDRLVTQAQLLASAGSPSWSRLQESRLDVAMAANLLGRLEDLLRGSLNAAPLQPRLTLACARAAALLGWSPTRGRDLARSASDLASREGDGVIAREGALVAAILGALGEAKPVAVLGVFDPTALAGDVIAIGPRGADPKPHVFLRRARTAWTDAHCLGPLGVTFATSPGYKPTYHNVTVVQTATDDALHAVVGVDAQVVTLRVWRDARPPDLRGSITVHPGEPVGVRAELVLTAVHEDGAPASALWLVREGGPNNDSWQLDIDRSGRVTRRLRLASARVHGHARLSAHPDQGDTVLLGLGEWAEGFAVQAQRLGDEHREIVRCGHVSALCAAIGDCFILAKSNREQTRDLLGHSRPLGWDRGVYLCRMQEDLAWKPVLADLGLDPAENKANLPGVACLRSAGTTLCMATSVAGDGGRPGVEARFYQVPANPPTSDTLQPWEPLLRVWHATGDLGARLWVADLDGDDHPEICQWRHDDKTKAVAVFAIPLGRELAMTAVPDAPSRAPVDAPDFPNIDKDCLVSVDPRIEIGADGTLHVDGISSWLPGAGAYVDYGGGSFEVAIDVTPRWLDDNTSFHVGLHTKALAEPEALTVAAQFGVGGGGGGMSNTIALQQNNLGQPQASISGSPFALDACHRLRISYDATKQTLAVDLRDPLRPEKVLVAAEYVSVRLDSGRFFVGLLPVKGQQDPIARFRADVAIRLSCDQVALRPLPRAGLSMDHRIAWCVTETGADDDPFDLCLRAESDKTLDWKERVQVYRRADAILRHAGLDKFSPLITGRWLKALLKVRDPDTLLQHAVRFRAAHMLRGDFAAQAEYRWWRDLAQVIDDEGVEQTYARIDGLALREAHRLRMRAAARSVLEKAARIARWLLPEHMDKALPASVVGSRGLPQGDDGAPAPMRARLRLLGYDLEP